MNLASVTTAGGLLLAVVSFVYGAWRAARGEKRRALADAEKDRVAALEKAVADAVKPWRDRAEIAERRCDEVSRATEQVVDQAVSIWRERVVDREHENATLKDERDSAQRERDQARRERDAYYRQLTERSGVDLIKPEDR